ncbi:peptide chain release factor N(5)-glutamine methyltransferase [Candidatus Peregrinibacteria bacterium]|nr:peptide chain release factor N(5)-glutamine methyltransferase [Candidatus Peregrinibacteria bacterium]
MIIKDALRWAHEFLLLSSNSARLDAEILLSYILNRPMTFLLAHDDSEIGYFKLRKFKNLVEKRKGGIPVAYLTGHREFYGLEFEVNKNVLVPRPDTEILVDSVISYLKLEEQRTKLKKNHKSQITNHKSQILLDVGTGSACIPISILKNVPEIQAIVTDISGSAIKVAKRNISKYKLKSRIDIIKSDLIASIPIQLLKDKQVILTANLPYIPEQFQIDPSTKFEPSVALYGGEDGLDIYKRLIKQLEENDIKPIAMFFELFEFQAAALCANMPDYKLKLTEDMTGEARLIMLERNI